MKGRGIYLYMGYYNKFINVQQNNHEEMKFIKTKKSCVVK